MDSPPPPPPWMPHLAGGQGDWRSGDGERGPGGLTVPWARSWTEAPERPVLHFDDVGWIRGGELERRTRHRAGALASKGLRAGERVLLGGSTSSETIVTHLAALRLGLVVVPLNAAYQQREVGQVAGVARPALALVDDAVQAAALRGAPVPAPVLRYQDLVDGEPDDRLDQAGGDDDALMVFTSGTTGEPKGVPLTHANLAASVDALGVAWRWTPTDRLVLALPLFHLHGVAVGLYGTLQAGASAVVQPSFAADAVLDAIGRHHATMFFGVPTMYQRLLDSGRIAELAPLRICVSGSAPLAPELHRRVATEGGQVILERYGMSETVMLVSNPYDGERRPGTVGLPLPGVSVRLDESSGEILVRGPNVFHGYWGRPEASADAFDGEWFRTGDLGRFDDDGYLTIVGRCKDLIISGGYNVYPREIEDVLRGVPGVRDVAVTGAPDPNWGEVVVAFVEGDPEPDELRLAAEAALAPYKRPRRVHRVTSLPRNALGKVVKAALEEP